MARDKWMEKHIISIWKNKSSYDGKQREGKGMYKINILRLTLSLLFLPL